ncbi:MAG: hypothetical protein O2971_14775 [Proteobacteria bacterium]|nr:hypothetical protein [Pseudomonadota bacterium]
MSIFRSIAAVILSLIATLVLLIAVEGFSAVVHPFPQDFDGSYQEMFAHVARYPNWVLAVCAVLWGTTALVATWLATRFGAARHPAHGIGVGALLVLALLFNMSQQPYPLWFEAICLVLIPLGIYWGVKLGRGASQGEPNSTTS